MHQLQHGSQSHFLVLPDVDHVDATKLVDATKASTQYFVSLVAIVFDCYERFKNEVDARWHYTKDNFVAMGKTLEDAVGEMGFPPNWLSCIPNEADAWRLLRSQQSYCQINDLFEKYLERRIVDPDKHEA